jgi:DNA-binding MarR family transcriptional regulator
MPSRPLPFDPVAEARRNWENAWDDDVAPRPMAAVTSVMRAQQILLARLNAELERWDLTFARYEALMLLFYSRNGALPLGKIGDRLQVHRASVTNAIDRLVAQGLVERVPHATDRRATLAQITKEGRRVARSATKRLNAQRFGTAPLDPKACDDLVDLLTPLRAGAGDFEDPPG